MERPLVCRAVSTLDITRWLCARRFGTPCRMPMLNVGDAAPDFTLPAHDGKTVKLSELKGKNIVLWFYPKADTPG